MPTIEVSAGLIFRAGKLLIAQRRAKDHLGGCWEFPGGKREPGETFEACLARELHEELGVRVAVGELIESVDHNYPGKSVHLRFFRCELAEHEPRPLGCAAIQWIERHQLQDFDFPPADARLLEKLQQSDEWWD